MGTVEYAAAWRLQEELACLVADGALDDTLLLLEHPPTLTLGRGADRQHLLVGPDRLDQLGISLHEADRGGDITYHGPGQLVGYPIVDLSRHRKDLHWYLREIEESLIDLLAGYGVEGRRFPPHTGVWIGDRKIAAIGVKVRRWVTTHGFALNVDPDLSQFGLIVPCGIAEYGVTSMHCEGQTTLEVADLLPPTARAFRKRFPGGPIYLQEPLNSALSPASSALWRMARTL